MFIQRRRLEAASFNSRRRRRWAPLQLLVPVAKNPPEISKRFRGSQLIVCTHIELKKKNTKHKTLKKINSNNNNNDKKTAKNPRQSQRIAGISEESLNKSKRWTRSRSLWT